MLRKPCLLLVFLLLCFGVLAPPGQTQEQGTIQALATVVSSLSVIGTNNLLFEIVTPGVNKSVDKVTAGLAGEWEITGTSSAEVTVEFTLPDSLLLISNPTFFMPISFSGTDVSYDDESGGGQASPAGVLNPWVLSTLNIGPGATLMIWIGGTVQPTISQTGGDYAADIVLTVAYTGS